LIIWSRQVALVLIFCGFAASGFLKWFYCRAIHRKSDFALSAESPAMTTADRGPTPKGDDSD
jgi:hypothetical protein